MKKVMGLKRTKLARQSERDCKLQLQHIAQKHDRKRKMWRINFNRSTKRKSDFHAKEKKKCAGQAAGKGGVQKTAGYRLRLQYVNKKRQTKTCMHN